MMIRKLSVRNGVSHQLLCNKAAANTIQHFQNWWCHQYTRMWNIFLQNKGLQCIKPDYNNTGVLSIIDFCNSPQCLLSHESLPGPQVDRGHNNLKALNKKQCNIRHNRKPAITLLVVISGNLFIVLFFIPLHILGNFTSTYKFNKTAWVTQFIQIWTMCCNFSLHSCIGYTLSTCMNHWWSMWEGCWGWIDSTRLTHRNERLT